MRFLHIFTEFSVVLVTTWCCLAKSCCVSPFDMAHAYGSGMIYSLCENWRLNMEKNDSQSWRSIPTGCESHVSEYVHGGQYKLDMELVSEEAITYAKNIKPEGDGKDVWIFDIDETALSNVAYYVEIQFGRLQFSHESWVEWETQAKAPPIEPVKALYNHLIKAEWGIFFLSGRHETRRNVTVRNLLTAGYSHWARLILREDAHAGMTAAVFKSSKRLDLEEQGYRIWGNIGDQWSDLKGEAAGKETFKIPNPMYYLM